MGSGPAGAAGGAASGAARTNPNITLNAQAAAAGRGGARLGGGLGALRKPGIGLQAFPSAAGSRDSVPWPPFWKAGEGGRIGGGRCWLESRGCSGSPWGPPPGRTATSDQGKSRTLQPGSQHGDRSGGFWVSL